MLARLNLLNADGKSSYRTGPYVEEQTHCSHIMLAVNGMSMHIRAIWKDKDLGWKPC